MKVQIKKAVAGTSLLAQFGAQQLSEKEQKTTKGGTSLVVTEDLVIM